MVFYANLTFMLKHQGWDLNAFFTFTVVFGMGYSWKEALGMAPHLWIDFFGYHINQCSKMIIESIPNAWRSAISAGIGIFLAYVGN